MRLSTVLPAHSFKVASKRQRRTADRGLNALTSSHLKINLIWNRVVGVTLANLGSTARPEQCADKSLTTGNVSRMFQRRITSSFTTWMIASFMRRVRPLEGSHCRAQCSGLSFLPVQYIKTLAEGSTTGVWWQQCALPAWAASPAVISGSKLHPMVINVCFRKTKLLASIFNILYEGERSGVANAICWKTQMGLLKKRVSKWVDAAWFTPSETASTNAWGSHPCRARDYSRLGQDV